SDLRNVGRREPDHLEPSKPLETKGIVNQHFKCAYPIPHGHSDRPRSDAVPTPSPPQTGYPAAERSDFAPDQSKYTLPQSPSGPLETSHIPEPPPAACPSRKSPRSNSSSPAAFRKPARPSPVPAPSPASRKS